MFEKDGKLNRLYPLYEAMDSFLFSTGHQNEGAPHVRDALDVKRLMFTVVIALLPCVFMSMWNTGLQANLILQGAAIPGWRGAVMSFIGLGADSTNFLANLVHGALYFLPVYIVCMAAGGVWEVLFAVVRRHEISEGFLVTGLLFPLTLPPAIPLWMVALGISFGVVIGKELFGGVGKNILNPALTARAFVFFAYPSHMTGDTIWAAVDGHTQATPLGALASADASTNMESLDVTWMDAFLGLMPGSMGETSAAACLFGAAVLILTGIGSWRVMLGMLLGGGGAAWLFSAIGGSTALWGLPVHWHLVVGSFAFGLVFMATDPVSAAQTNAGRWVYGVFIGIVSMLIRIANPAYPEGVMLAILMGNVFAPLIDWFVVQANIKRRAARYG